MLICELVVEVLSGKHAKAAASAGEVSKVLGAALLRDEDMDNYEDVVVFF